MVDFELQENRTKMKRLNIAVKRNGYITIGESIKELEDFDNLRMYNMTKHIEINAIKEALKGLCNQ